MKADTCAGCQSPKTTQNNEQAVSGSRETELSTGKGGITKFKTVCAFFKNGTCSKTLMNVLGREFDQAMKPEEQACDPLAGGLMQGYQCGMLWGSTLAAGARSHKLFGASPEAENKALSAAQGLVKSFRGQNEHINCLEITEADPNNKWQTLWHFLFKGGTFRCAAKIANFAPEARAEINKALNQNQDQPPCNPANCAARLAKKMGASDKHAVMAAGLAGGIGLSGGACGALGATIWLLGMKGREAGLSNKAIKTKISETMDSFLKSSGFEYECSEIVGRKFENAADHADFVHQGGCSDIIEALVAAAETVPEEVPSTVEQEPVFAEE